MAVKAPTKVKAPAPAPVLPPPPAPTAAPEPVAAPAPTEGGPWVGDNYAFWLWLSCAALLAALLGKDLIVSLWPF